MTKRCIDCGTAPRHKSYPRCEPCQQKFWRKKKAPHLGGERRNSGRLNGASVNVPRTCKTCGLTVTDAADVPKHFYRSNRGWRGVCKPCYNAQQLERQSSHAAADVRGRTRTLTVKVKVVPPPQTGDERRKAAWGLILDTLAAARYLRGEGRE